MSRLPYKIFHVLTWPAKLAIRVCETWRDWLWGLCHYKYGNGPKVPYQGLYQTWKMQKYKD